MAEWELALTGAGPPMRHLKPSALYRLPLPKTKLEAPVPDGSASGHVVLDGALVDVVGWRATVGHNWGAEHAERWVWLHAAGFEDEPDTWLELAIARVRVGGALTPWVANGAVAHGGQRFRLGGLGHVAGVRVIARPGRLEAIVPGDRVNIRVAVHADLDQTVGFTYAGIKAGATIARSCTPGSPTSTCTSAAPAAARPSWRRTPAAPTSWAGASSRARSRSSPTPTPRKLRARR